VIDFFPDPRETLVLHEKELLRLSPEGDVTVQSGQSSDRFRPLRQRPPGLLNAATGARTPLVDLTGLAFSDASLSPDGLWLAVTVTRPDGLAALYLMPADHPTPRDSWVQIAEDRNYLSRAAWSPDGKLVYYASTRDNFWCLWAQRVTARGKLESPPLPALHLHRFLESNFLGGVYFAVGPEDLYILLSELKGNAWMVKLDR
jgi:hypothetical protein